MYFEDILQTKTPSWWPFCIHLIPYDFQKITVYLSPRGSTTSPGDSNRSWTLRILTPPIKTPDPPNDTPGPQNRWFWHPMTSQGVLGNLENTSSRGKGPGHVYPRWVFVRFRPLCQVWDVRNEQALPAKEWVVFCRVVLFCMVQNLTCSQLLGNIYI